MRTHQTNERERNSEIKKEGRPRKRGEGAVHIPANSFRLSKRRSSRFYWLTQNAGIRGLIWNVWWPLCCSAIKSCKEVAPEGREKRRNHLVGNIYIEMKKIMNDHVNKNSCLDKEKQVCSAVGKTVISSKVMCAKAFISQAGKGSYDWFHPSTRLAT